ncbi:MAG: GNAT family N-acetyltransferase [Planctomycetota bacterium]
MSGQPRVRVERVRTDQLHNEWLERFDRTQRTTRVLRQDGVSLSEDDSTFDDDWDAAGRHEVIRALRSCDRRGGAVLAILEAGEPQGFAAVEPERFGPDRAYVELNYLHVTGQQRGRGFGAELFRASCTAARALGASNLYIGAHPAVETQRFYAAMGCAPSAYVHPPILEREPLDIQLVFRLDASQG